MKKKLLAFALCLSVALLFVGCGKGGSSSGKADTTVVATIGGEDITMDELQYFLIQEVMNHSADYQDAETGKIKDDFWDSEVEVTKTGEKKKAADAVLENALNAAAEFHLYEIKAKEQKLELTKEDEDTIKSQKSSMVESYGEEMYQAQLKAAGFTEETFMKLMTLSAYSQKLYEKFSTDKGEDAVKEETKKYFDDNYIKAKHILIATQNSETGEPLEGEELDKKKAVVKEVQDKIAAGEDFDQLIKDYGEDPGMESSPEGYVFGEGEMVEEFYEGAKALDVDAISEPIETSYGFHIIKRLALTDEDYTEKEETIKNTVLSKQFMEQLDQWKTELEVETTSAYDKIDVKKIMDQYLKDYDEASKIIDEQYKKMQEEQSAAEAEYGTPADGSAPVEEAAPADDAAVEGEAAPAEEAPAEESK